MNQTPKSNIIQSVWFGLLLMILMAIILTAIFTLRDTTDPSLTSFQDGHLYVSMANTVVDAEKFWTAFVDLLGSGSFGIGLAVVLVPLYELFGFSYWVTNILNLILWLVSGFIVYRIAILSFNRSTSLLISLLFLTMPTTFYAVHSAFSENLYQPLALASVLFISLYYSKSGHKDVRLLLWSIGMALGAFFTRTIGFTLFLALIATALTSLIVNVESSTNIINRVYDALTKIIKKYDQPRKIAFLYGCLFTLIILGGWILIRSFRRTWGYYFSYAYSVIHEQGSLPTIPEILETISFDFIHVYKPTVGGIILGLALMGIFYGNRMERVTSNLYFMFYISILIIFPAFDQRYLYLISPFIIINVYTFLSRVCLKISTRFKPVQHLPAFVFVGVLSLHLYYFTLAAFEFSGQKIAFNTVQAFEWIDRSNDDKVAVHYRSNYIIKAHGLEKTLNLNIRKTALLDDISAGEYLITSEKGSKIKYLAGPPNNPKYWFWDLSVKILEKDPRFDLIKQIDGVKVWQRGPA